MVLFERKGKTMGIFGRMTDVINANVNDLLDRAENPEKMLKQIIREIEDGIDKSRREMAKVLAEAKRLDKEVDAKAKETDEWVNRAEMAIDQDNDELARKAIERKLAYEKELATLQTQGDETRAAVDQMKDNIKLLSDKLTEARAKRTALAARASAAKTAKQVQKQVRDLADPGKALGKLEKLERRVEDAEAEASAMAAANQAQNEVEKEFKDMEDNLAVDSELAALKAKRKKK